jgi:hypothetical protein
MGMAEIVRNPNPANVLEEIFIGVRCDCGSEDCEPCEQDGSPLMLGMLFFVRCKACSSIYEIIYPNDFKTGATAVWLIGKREE